MATTSRTISYNGYCLDLLQSLLIARPRRRVRPIVRCHTTGQKTVKNIVKKAGKRIYMLYQLKRAGVNQADLITIYISVVRPVVEYACPVWNTNLPIYLSDNIEMIQKRAVRAIFPGMSYDDILTHINLSTLKDRH